MNTNTTTALVCSALLAVGPALADVSLRPLSEHELQTKHQIRYAFLRCSSAYTVVAARLVEHLDNVPEDDEMSVAFDESVSRAELFHVFAQKIHQDANPRMSKEAVTEFIDTSIEKLAATYAMDYADTMLLMGDGNTSLAFVDMTYCPQVLETLAR